MSEPRKGAQKKRDKRRYEKNKKKRIEVANKWRTDKKIRDEIIPYNVAIDNLERCALDTDDLMEFKARLKRFDFEGVAVDRMINKESHFLVARSDKKGPALKYTGPNALSLFHQQAYQSS